MRRRIGQMDASTYWLLMGKVQLLRLPPFLDQRCVMVSISMILLIVAFILFVLSAISVPVPRINLMSAGLACWVLAVLLGGVGRI